MPSSCVARPGAVGVVLALLASRVRAEDAPAPPPSAPPDATGPTGAAEGAPAVPELSPALSRAVVAAALRASGHPGRALALASLATRARTAALLPEVWLRAMRSTDQSLRLSPTTDDPYRYTQGGGAGLWMEARLVWHLDRLAFDREELAVQRLEAERADAAAKLRARVLEVLFAWQRARVREADRAARPEEHVAAGLDRVEAAVSLDVLTGGWFSAELARRGP